MSRFETFCILFAWSSFHSIGIYFFAGWKRVDLVVTFNKGREETFAVSLQNRKSCVCIKYLTLVRPQKLILWILRFYTWCKMLRTPVLLKNYSFHNFLNRSKFAFVCFFKKKFSPQKMLMSCFCLCHGTYLKSTSNVLTYLLIIFLGSNWFGFFLNKWGCIRSTP